MHEYFGAYFYFPLIELLFKNKRGSVGVKTRNSGFQVQGSQGLFIFLFLMTARMNCCFEYRWAYRGKGTTITPWIWCGISPKNALPGH